MKRSEDRILTTHVGSIVRPKELLALGAAAKSDVAKKQAYEICLKDAVAAVVTQQADVGLDIVNDGEFGKSGWTNYILARLSGFEIREHQIIPVDWVGSEKVRFAEFMKESFPRAIEGAPAEVCVGPIAYVDHEPIRRDVANLNAAMKAVKGKEAFFTVVAPASTAINGVNEYYKSDRDYAFAIAEALRVEYQEVYQAGLIVQVDDAVLANNYDRLMRQSRQHYRDWAEVRIDALNHALQGIPEDRVRYHVCFGSWHVPHTTDAPLEAIIDLVLKVKAGAYSIEAANVRHEHEYHLWEKVKLPAGKILIPGVITHHTTTVEHPRLVAERLVRFAKLVGRENVIAGTDCGFAQGESIARVHPSVMWAKFEALVEGARLASEELWGRKAA